MSDIVKAVQDRRWDDVKKFLEENKYYTLPELSLIVGRSMVTLRRWRQKVGLSRESPFKGCAVVPRAAFIPNKIIDKSEWDNAEWFHQQYEVNGLGLKKISLIISRRPKIVIARLKKYGIATRSFEESMKSNNPCSTHEWIVYHYATREEYLEWINDHKMRPDAEGGKGWTIAQCASVASTTPSAVHSWLVKAVREGCKFSLRDHRESRAGKRNKTFGSKIKVGNVKPRTASNIRENQDQ